MNQVNKITVGWQRKWQHIFYPSYVTGEKECHNKTVQSLVDVPEENCELFPHKTCQGKNPISIFIGT